MQHVKDFTLREWVARWIDVYAPLRCKSNTTIERYVSLSKYLGATEPLRAAAGRSLSGLTSFELQEAVLSLLESKGQRCAKLSRHTVRHFGALIRTALDRAFKIDLIPCNPMRRVELPGFDVRTARSLTEFEIGELRQSCAGDWTGLFVELALATGCRRGELLALEWTDWNGRILRIGKSIEETGAGLRIKRPKNNQSRSCTLPRVAIRALAAERISSRTVLIFGDEWGQYRSPALVSQIIVRRLRRAGIRNASLHTLRHTHASLLLSRGVPLPAVSTRLGHADPAITARIYGHALPPDDERAAEAWDLLLADAG